MIINASQQIRCETFDFDIQKYDAIMFEAVLSAINLGVKPPTASLGSLIADAQAMLQFYPYQILIPAVMLVLISLAFILLGDGLRDAFDPRASED